MATNTLSQTGATTATRKSVASSCFNDSGASILWIYENIFNHKIVFLIFFIIFMAIIRFTNLTVYDATGRRGQNSPSYHFLSPKSLQGQDSLATSCF